MRSPNILFPLRQLPRFNTTFTTLRNSFFPSLIGTFAFVPSGTRNRQHVICVGPCHAGTSPLSRDPSFSPATRILQLCNSSIDVPLAPHARTTPVHSLPHRFVVRRSLRSPFISFRCAETFSSLLIRASSFPPLGRPPLSDWAKYAVQSSRLLSYVLTGFCTQRVVG